MTVWDYNDLTETLIIRRIDQGETYTVYQKATTAKLLAFWIKHYTYLDTDDFKLCVVIHGN